MLKKATTYTVLFILLISLISACSGKSPTGSTVNMPDVKNGNSTGATAASGAYPAATAVKNQAAYPAANAAPTNASAYPAAAAAPLAVVKTDGTSVSISPADLANFPVKNITVGTKNLAGVSVANILTKAGITDYKQITFVGANGSQTLTKDKVDENVILTINPDGTLQLASPKLTENQWLKSINTIKAE